MDGSVNAIHTTSNSSVKSSVYTVVSVKQTAVYFTHFVNSQELIIELNTGCDNFVVGLSVWNKLGTPRLYVGMTLTAYGGHSLPMLGR